MLTGILVDLKHVLRGLAASRTFTVVAILSLAIGIGANAAIYSVIRVLLLDPLPVRAPEELSLVYWHQPGKVQFSQMNSAGATDPASGLSLRSNYSYPIYESLRAAAPPGTSVFGFNFLRDVAVQFADQPAISAGGMLADGAYFPVLQPRMALGRALGEIDDVEGGPVAVVLSHGFWMRAFGGDPDIVGRTIRVNGVPADIVGVTAAEFRGLSKGGFFPQTEITLPLKAAPRLNPRWVPDGVSLLRSNRHFWVRTMARIPAGTDPAGVRTALAAAIAPHMAPLQTDPAAGPASVFLLDGSRGSDQNNRETRRLLFILMGVVGAVLVIACVNLASLMLARGVARQRELSVRRALGAARLQLIRGLLIEGVVLAMAGAMVGLLFTYWSRRVLTTILTAGIGTAPLSTQPLEVTIDLRLVLATFALSLTAAVLFALLPAWRLTRASATGDLKHQVLGARSPRLTLGRSLVALQIAVSVPLLVGAILFLRTLANLGAVELGFNPQGLVYFKVDPSTTGGSPADHAATYLDLLDRLRAIPGVTSATLVENALLSGWTSNGSVRVGDAQYMLYKNAVGPGFIDTMGMRLVAGRAPGIQDRPGTPLVAVLNESAARLLFGDQSPIGQRLGSGPNAAEIIGIVSDSLYDRQRAEIRPTMFDAALQRPGYGGHHVVVRASVPVDALEPALRQAVAEINRDLPIASIKSQIAQMDELTIRERVFAQLLTMFAGFALLLACIGLHGVTAYSVARRTNEIGVRVALGARPGQVVWLVQRQVVVLALAGIVVGVPLAVGVAPLVGSLLFGVAPTDTAVIVVASLVLLFVAAAAGFLPARRAAQLDPLKALRSE